MSSLAIDDGSPDIIEDLEAPPENPSLKPGDLSFMEKGRDPGTKEKTPEELMAEMEEGRAAGPGKGGRKRRSKVSRKKSRSRSRRTKTNKRSKKRDRRRK
jgi:hypothetical protein